LLALAQAANRLPGDPPPSVRPSSTATASVAKVTPLIGQGLSRCKAAIVVPSSTLIDLTTNRTTGEVYSPETTEGTTEVRHDTNVDDVDVCPSQF
jgi:hypothetical protein